MIDLKLRPTPGAVPDARRALDALDEQVSAQTLDDLRLLVSELVTNSVRHARLLESQTIELKVKLLPETVQVEVNDQGGGFQPTPRTEQSDDQSGWGLYLVDQISDRWGVRSRPTTCVWLELDARSS